MTSLTPLTALTRFVSCAVSVCGVTPKILASTGELWPRMSSKEAFREDRPTKSADPTRTQTKSVAAVAADRPELRARLRVASCSTGSRVSPLTLPMKPMMTVTSRGRARMAPMAKTMLPPAVKKISEA